MYADAGHIPIHVIRNVSNLQEDVDDFHYLLDAKLEALTSLAERLDLVEKDRRLDNEVSSITGSSVSDVENKHNEPERRVFIVHRHDEEMKEVVTRFLDKCLLQPIILREQADKDLPPYPVKAG